MPEGKKIVKFSQNVNAVRTGRRIFAYKTAELMFICLYFVDNLFCFIMNYNISLPKRSNHNLGNSKIEVFPVPP